MRYHVKKDGLPGRCTASVRSCPLGGEENHFDSLVEAATAIEERSKSQLVPQPVSKKTFKERVDEAITKVRISGELLDHLEDNRSAFVDELDRLVAAHDAVVAQDKNVDRTAYQKANGELRGAEFNLVKTVIESYHDAGEIPTSVREKVWNLAWEQGHSSGYNEVSYYYADYADLAVEAYRAGRHG